MGKKIPMTREGYEKLLLEMKRLKNIDLPKILKEVQIAREHGDLSENAEYKFGKEAQRNTERKIGEIEYKLANAEIIDVTKMEGDTVIFGTTVTLLDLDTDEEISYKIVGEDESDLDQGKISYLAPLAQRLIGKEEGDEVELRTSNKRRVLEIVNVEYK